MKQNCLSNGLENSGRDIFFEDLITGKQRHLCLKMPEVLTDFFIITAQRYKNLDYYLSYTENVTREINRLKYSPRVKVMLCSYLLKSYIKSEINCKHTTYRWFMYLSQKSMWELHLNQNRHLFIKAPNASLSPSLYNIAA